MPSAEFQPLSSRFERAFSLASELHRTQARKQSPIPYISHLMAVAALVLEHGGDENQAIAALLHDAAEDQGGEPTLARIRSEFGDDVADLVRECSQPLDLTQEQWRERKLAYLRHLGTATPRARLIAGCDKVHNAGCLLAALEEAGERAFERFSGKANGTREWHAALAETLCPMLPAALSRQLAACASRIARSPERALWFGDGTVRVQTSPVRYWPLEELPVADATLGDWRAWPWIKVGGPGPLFLYLFVAARAACHGATGLLVERPGDDPIAIERSCAVPERSPGGGISVVRDGATAGVLVRALPGARFSDFSATASHALQCVRPGDHVIVTGRMPVALGAALAFLGVARGATRISCIAPPDGMGLATVFGSGLGHSEPLRDWLLEHLRPRESPARTIGVIGFPNSGKSILSRLVGKALLQHGRSRTGGELQPFESWVFEADSASPTPPWYLELERYGHPGSSDLRNACKVLWTPELQDQIARRLRNARRFLDMIVVDLPGGDMRDPNRPDPIPEGRESLFKEIDEFVILRRPDRNDDVSVWIRALAEHGLQDRVIAVLESVDVQGDLRVTLRGPSQPKGLWTGTVHGLRRDIDLDRPPEGVLGGLLPLLALAAP